MLCHGSGVKMGVRRKSLREGAMTTADLIDIDIGIGDHATRRVSLASPPRLTLLSASTTERVVTM
jgi:hypothetical protein